MARPEFSQEFPCSYSAIVVIDAHAEIKFSYWDRGNGREAKDILCESSEPHLRSWLKILVRSFTCTGRSLELHSYVIFRQAGRTLRLLPMAGSEGTLFTLVMEEDPDAAAIARAASRFQLTRRQSEVLELLLGGASAGDVARSLVISEYTAQGYVKTLLEKTDSRNRAAMVAKVLNWKQAQTSDTRETRNAAAAL